MTVNQDPNIKPIKSIVNPSWTRDELILALDLYFRVPAARGSKSHPECIKLSKILNELPINRGKLHSETFRNPNGVGMKLSNFLKYDPTYTGKGLTAGSRLEREVWTTFSGSLKQLRHTAEAILRGAKELANDGILIGETVDSDDETSEGRILTEIHKRRERDPTIISKKKQKVMSKTGALKCEICEFDFAVTYGEIGLGFAECHHSRAVSELKPDEKTRLSDLHIVCANCHRMLHRSKPWLTLDKLKGLLQKR